MVGGRCRRPGVECETVREDSDAGTKLAEEPRLKAEIDLRQEVEHDGRGGGEIGFKEVLEAELDEMIDASPGRPGARPPVRRESASMPTPLAPKRMAASIRILPSPEPRSKRVSAGVSCKGSRIAGIAWCAVGM
jgi:hypothetical protein